MKKIFFFIFLTLLNASVLFVRGQENVMDTATIDVTGFKEFLDLTYTQFEVAVTRGVVTDYTAIQTLQFEKPESIVGGRGRVPDSLNNALLYLRFRLRNPTLQSMDLYVYAGFYFKSKHLYRSSQEAGGGFRFSALRDELPDVKDADHYRRIHLLPGETSTFYLQLQPVNIFGNKLDLQLLKPEFLSLHGGIVKQEKNEQDIITYILVGILSMMALFAISNFFVTGKNEFVFYFLYVLFTALLLFCKTYLYHAASNFNYFFEEYLDFIIMLLSIFFYIYFLKYFLDTAEKFPLLDKLLRVVESVNAGFVVLYSFTYFLSDNISWLQIMETAMKILLLSGAIVFIITGLRQKSRLLNYIAWGNLALVLFGLISLALIIIAPPVDSIFKNALFYYDLGIVFEMAFFLVGLTYKNRMDIIHSVQLQDALVQEREKKNFHEQLAMIQAQQEERNRISADMHDELGGGMTAIRLMSEIARQRNEAEQIPELEKISDSANDLLGKMNAIIWSMSLANDSLSNLIAYVRSYALEFFESTPIKCTVAEEDHLPTVEITGIKRRNLFFAVKEILQLLAKMPSVGDIKLVFEVAGEWLRIRIFYNGSPMDEARDKRDALQPLLSRLNSIGGACHFFTDESNYLELEVPI